MGLFRSNKTVDPDALASTALFREQSPEDLARIAKLAVRREIAAGETFIEQGRFGTECFVIAEGSANVYIGGDYVTTLPAGAAVGEMALLERRPRSATVIAETPMVVAEFGVTEFRKMLEEHPTANLRIMEVLNTRLGENADRN